MSSSDIKGRIAVVDDDRMTRVLLRALLEREGYAVSEHGTGMEVLASAGPFAAVCLDLGLGDLEGTEVLRHLRARDPDLPVIVITGDGAIDTAIEAMRAGAYDYLVKPVVAERLLPAIQRAVERRRLADDVERLRRQLSEREGIGAIVGQSASIRRLTAEIQRVVDSDIPVSIWGETGTGKELVARAIHQGGARAGGPFVAINCASISESLLESELFGHERGAFTGAIGSHRGRFEQANGGTLFLDELGEMMPSTQAALLRTVQERTIRRVGGTAEIPVNVRIISATHRRLEDEVKAGRFREDLYYRLVVYPIHLPALRERADDIPLLARHFLAGLTSDGAAPQRIAADALEALCRYEWPGNVREMQNVLQRAALACDGPEILLGHLPPQLRAGVLSPLPAAPRSPTIGGEPRAAAPALADTVTPLRELERREIDKAMALTRGNVQRAAALLGIGRATLYRHLT